MLHLSGDNTALKPFRVLWDTGSSHCILSPDAARRLEFYVPDKPDGHGSMAVADGSTTGIYGWTHQLRVRPPIHLAPSNGAVALITELPSIACLVADIPEDVIVGVDYIFPLSGGFATTKGTASFRLATSTIEDAPTLLVPLLCQPTDSDRHYALSNGHTGASVETYHCTIDPNNATPGGRRGRESRTSSKRERTDALSLLHYQRDHPNMVTQIEYRPQNPMTPGKALFPDVTHLHTEPQPEPPPDERRDSAWVTVQERFEGVFRKPYKLPPFRSVNGTCNLQPGCNVPPRAGVGRLSQEEIQYTRSILTDYLNKGWIQPSYSSTAARLFFVTKQNGSLRSVVDYRRLNEVLETQYFPPPEWTNIVNQLGDSQYFSTFNCSDFFFF